MKNYNAIWRKSYEEGINFKAFDPKCYLIIGNTSELNAKQIENFNLFKNELKTVRFSVEGERTVFPDHARDANEMFLTKRSDAI